MDEQTDDLHDYYIPPRISNGGIYNNMCCFIMLVQRRPKKKNGCKLPVNDKDVKYHDTIVGLSPKMGKNYIRIDQSTFA